MALILNLETATKVCSVTLAEDGVEIITKEMKSDKFSHSENLNLFIEAIFNETDYRLKDIDAVAVSKGPGSYTGLRIGVSAAKGFCYGLDVPLISVDSLEAVAYLALQNPENFKYNLRSHFCNKFKHNLIFQWVGLSITYKFNFIIRFLCFIMHIQIID